MTKKDKKSPKTRLQTASGGLQPGPNGLQLTLEVTWDHYRTIRASNRPSSTEIWVSLAGTLPEKGQKWAKNGQKMGKKTRKNRKTPKKMTKKRELFLFFYEGREFFGRNLFRAGTSGKRGSFVQLRLNINGLFHCFATPRRQNLSNFAIFFLHFLGEKNSHFARTIRRSRR